MFVYAAYANQMSESGFCNLLVQKILNLSLTEIQIYIFIYTLYVPPVIDTY